MSEQQRKCEGCGSTEASACPGCGMVLCRPCAEKPGEFCRCFCPYCGDEVPGSGAHAGCANAMGAV